MGIRSLKRRLIDCGHCMGRSALPCRRQSLIPFWRGTRGLDIMGRQRQSRWWTGCGCQSTHAPRRCPPYSLHPVQLRQSDSHPVKSSGQGFSLAELKRSKFPLTMSGAFAYPLSLEPGDLIERAVLLPLRNPDESQQEC